MKDFPVYFKIEEIEIKDILPEAFIDGTTVDGNIYALVNNSAGVGTWGIQMRKDLIEKYGLIYRARSCYEVFESALWK